MIAFYKLLNLEDWNELPPVCAVHLCQAVQTDLIVLGFNTKTGY